MSTKTDATGSRPGATDSNANGCDTYLYHSMDDGLSQDDLDREFERIMTESGMDLADILAAREVWAQLLPIGDDEGPMNDDKENGCQTAIRSDTFEIAINRQFVNKLGNGDQRWEAFNNGFENETLTEVQLRQAIRSGYAFTSPHRHDHIPLGQDKNGNERFSAYRHSVNWLGSQHLALDHDGVGIDELLHNDFIYHYASFLYTTPSHTPEAPRCRSVFILAAPITDKTAYVEAAAALHWTFSGIADSACKDASRVFFGSKDCRIRNIGNVLPLTVLEQLRTEFRGAMEAEQAKRRTRVNVYAATPDLARVQAALTYIPPQMDYADWLSCLMAVHSEFPGPVGISVCEAWSPGYPGEIEHKFRTFNSNGNSTGRIGMGTLYHMAKEHGWDPSVKMSTKDYDELASPVSRIGVDDSPTLDERAAPTVSIIGDFSEMPPLPIEAYIPLEVAAGASPWLDGYIEHSRQWSPRGYDGFHEAVGLWVLSTVAARRVLLHFGHPRYPSLMIALAGRTSLYAKTTTTNIGISLLEDTGLRHLLMPDDATPQAFIQGMVQRRVPQNWHELSNEQRLAFLERKAFAAQRGWFYEEFGQKVSAMMREGGIMADFRGILRRFDDAPSRYEYNTVGRGPDLVIAPYLPLLANLTPADLQPFAKRGTALWHDGTWARFAFITPPSNTPRPRGRFPDGERVAPPYLSQKLKAWHNRLGIPKVDVTVRPDPNGKGPDKYDLTVEPLSPQQIRLGPGVFEAFYRYQDALADIVEQSANHDLDGNYTRFPEKAVRIAVLIASLENGGCLEMRHWARAQQITERWRQYLHNLYTEVTGAAQSRGEELEEKILRLIAEKGGEKGLTKRDIHRGIRGLDSAHAEIILQSMVNAEDLTMRQDNRATYYTVCG